MRVAAIDLGTVTARLLIGDVGEHGIDECLRLVQITHFGQGLSQDGFIAADAIKRELKALKVFKAAIADFESQTLAPVDQMRVVATSALRDAKNYRDILEQMADVGFNVEIIAGSLEAKLSFNGTILSIKHDSSLDAPQDKKVLQPESVVKCDQDTAGGFNSNTMRIKKPDMASLKAIAPLLTIDVGGGSTELVFGDLVANEVKIIQAQSFDLGCKRLTEQCFLDERTSNLQLDEAKKLVHEILEPFFRSLPRQVSLAIAVAGTAVSALTIRDRITSYAPQKTHGGVVLYTDLDQIIARLSCLSVAERRHIAGLEPNRASVIVAGLVILRKILELAKLDSFVVSETDILHGILLACFGQTI